MSYLTSAKPDALQLCAQDLCDGLRRTSPGDDECARTLHGLLLFLAKVQAEAGSEVIKRQLPYLTSFLVGALRAVVQIRKSEAIRTIATVVMDKVVRLDIAK